MARAVNRFVSWLSRTPGAENLGWTNAILARVERVHSLKGLSVPELQHRLRAVPTGFIADDDLLGEYLAVIRELADTELGLRPHDVQVRAAAAMLRGVSVELATGEGKTLVGAMVAIGLSLSGHQVHVLAANDYLASRDAEWMGPLYRVAGVAVEAVTSATDRSARRGKYATEVVYIPVTEAGFDVLRDRICLDESQMVGIRPDLAVLDEADAVLLDEGKVPLVLATQGQRTGAQTQELVRIVADLVADEDYRVDDDRRTVELTEAGLRVVEERLDGLDLFGADAEWLNRVNNALHAHALLRRDVDYVVEDGRVRLVSQSRGRVDALRRWPEGLQEAVELEEGLQPTSDAVVLDQLTINELMSLYGSVVGMSATLVSAADELLELCGLAVGSLPPDKPCIRVDEPDQFFEKVLSRDAAAVRCIAAAAGIGQPVLVGTQSVAESERFGELLDSQGLSCVILNAKNDAHEAATIALAGESGRITVSTQMAGRGTDIRLGDGVGDIGGLLVVGIGRFPSKRLDDQLRGRAGRQGDPGRSVFFTSLEDDLVKMYASDHVPHWWIDKEGRVIGGRRILKVVDHAQKVSDGQEQSLRDLSKRYGRLPSIYRQRLLALREDVLKTDRAVVLIAEVIPERIDDLGERVCRKEVEGACRTAMLASLNKQWSDYLEFAASVREGIHLVALAREEPLLRYQSQIAEQAEAIVGKAVADAAAAIGTASVVDGQIVLDDTPWYHPGATWTYTVTDNPFGSELERVSKAFGRMWRGQAPWGDRSSLG